MKIGITSTVPIEAILAAGHTALDLNNLFISHPERAKLIERAERDGYPVAACAWIKGIYGAVLSEGIDTMVAVVGGDCSNTQALAETLEAKGVRLIPFAYPHDKDVELLANQIERFCQQLGTTVSEAERVRVDLSAVRAKLSIIDELTWKGGNLSGLENHLALVSSSDMQGDVETFEGRLDELIARASRRQASSDADSVIRLGYIGVPPINPDLYDFVEKLGARVVFNEVQRQFAMLGHSRNLVEQYLQYTYPYDVFGRLADIQEQIALRRLDAVVHYTQAFCFRQIEDVILRDRLSVPVLSIEGNYPGALSAQNRLRLEAFIEQLRLSSWRR